MLKFPTLNNNKNPKRQIIALSKPSLNMLIDIFLLSFNDVLKRKFKKPI
jgi:hypothetical protein